MISYVFTILEKKYYWNKVYENLTKKHQNNFEIVLALTEDNPEKADVLKFAKTVERVQVVLLEENASENAMVNQAIKKAQGKELVLCRDYFAYQTIFSDYMLEMGQKGAQIIVYKKIEKPSKFKSFFSKLYNKIVKYIFGFRLYEGEVGLIYFNNIAFSVLKELPNSTLLTKVNKWAGFEISYIEIEENEISKAKLESKELKPLLIKIVSLSVFSALLIVGFVLLAVFKKLSFILGILFIFVFLISNFILFYNCLKHSIIKKYGDLRE